MAEIDAKQHEKDSVREILVISIIGLIIFLLLVLYGFKRILGYNGFL
jgi:FtsH-binding integral membrane protein